MSPVDRRTDADARTSRSERAVSLACGAMAVGVLIWHSGRFFPLLYGFLGHDYGFFLPHLLIGEDWFRRNGFFEPPYYTPAFCGGMPWLGDPQSIVYSIPQAFAFLLDPIRTFYATLLLSAGAGAIGTLGLLRYGFRTTSSAAVLGAVLFLLNGFLIYRMAVGHVTFHVFAIAPLVAWALLHPANAGSTANRRWPLAGRGVVCGALIAYIVYGGALNLLIPIVLTVACTVLVEQVRAGFRVRPWILLAGSCAWALAIAAMKLAPAFVLAGKFPRSYIPENLFSGVTSLIGSLGMALFVPELLPENIALGAGRTTLSRHEFEFGLSIVPLLLAGLGVWRTGWRLDLRGRYGLLAVLVAILLLPLVLNVGPDWWGRLLLQVPVIQNNTTFVRWWLLYIVPAIAMTALTFDRVARTSRTRMATLVVCVAVITVQTTRRDVRYYTDPERRYNPKFVTAAHDALRAGVPLPAIERVGRPDYVLARASYFARNDALLNGATSWPCYEPLFGYTLELLPDPGLREGPVLARLDEGRLNMVDPESYLRTGPEAPKAERFASDHIDRATNFAAYRPVPRLVPGWQRVATAVSVSALLLSLLTLAWTALTALYWVVWSSGHRGI